ncbi:MAG: hypothetical protein KC994_12890, partial [Candidatus Omnitrophica bacterium]|nr:hypothetical protein [Candidatus Omnitrophota bacterium]
VPAEINNWVVDPSTSIGDEIWAEVGGRFDEDVQDSLTQIEKIVNRSDFTYDLLSPDLDKNKALGGLARFLLVRSRWYLERGHTDSAINDWFLTMQLSRRTPYARVMQQMMADGILSMNLKHFSALADQIADGGQAQEVLAQLTEMRPMVCNGFFEDPVRAVVLDLAGVYEQVGGSFKVIDGEPARESTRQIWAWSSPFSQTSPAEGNFLGRAVSHVTMSENPLTRFWQLHDMMLAMSLQHLLSVREKERIFQVRFDLARLYLANRIREMEGRDLATQASNLIPEFFEEEPLDPFTGEGFLWSTENRQFYSAGPDGDDDKMKREQPMGGAKNPDGDVSLP